VPQLTPLLHKVLQTFRPRSRSRSAPLAGGDAVTHLVVGPDDLTLLGREFCQAKSVVRAIIVDAKPLPTFPARGRYGDFDQILLARELSICVPPIFEEVSFVVPPVRDVLTINSCHDVENLFLAGIDINRRAQRVRVDKHGHGLPGCGAGIRTTIGSGVLAHRPAIGRSKKAVPLRGRKEISATQCCAGSRTIQCSCRLDGGSLETRMRKTRFLLL
jgi:hypothetical protein